MAVLETVDTACLFVSLGLAHCHLTTAHADNVGCIHI